jgi:hypothetical protein
MTKMEPMVGVLYRADFFPANTAINIEQIET